MPIPVCFAVADKFPYYLPSRLYEAKLAVQINVHNSLDERHACKMFLDKSIEEAEKLFCENALFYQEDLMWMGPIAFRFYVEAAIRCIQSETSSGDSDIICCLASVLEFRMGPELVPIAAKLALICAYIVEQCERFDLTPKIYGDVRARYRVHQRAFEGLT